MNRYISLLFIKLKENGKITSAPCQQLFRYISFVISLVSLRACSVNTCFSRAAFFFFFFLFLQATNTSERSCRGYKVQAWLGFLREKATSVVVAAVFWPRDMMGFCLHCTVLLTSAEAKAALCTSLPAAPLATRQASCSCCPYGATLTFTGWLWGEPLALAASDRNPSWQHPHCLYAATVASSACTTWSTESRRTTAGAVCASDWLLSAVALFCSECRAQEAGTSLGSPAPPLAGATENLSPKQEAVSE